MAKLTNILDGCLISKRGDTFKTKATVKRNIAEQIMSQLKGVATVKIEPTRHWSKKNIIIETKIKPYEIYI